MKKVLIYLVEFLKEQHGMSMSEMSKGIGKSRNFIRETINRGYEDEEKYIKVINSLKCNFFFSDDYNSFYKFIEKKHQQELYKTEVAGDKVVDFLHEQLSKSKEVNKELEQRIVVLSREVDKAHDKVVELKDTITTKELFIDGQDKEIKDYNNLCNRQQTSIESLKEVSSELGIENNKLQKQNYILIGLLAVSSAIALFGLLLK